MPSISQNIFAVTQSTFPRHIPITHYSFGNVGSAIDNLLSLQDADSSHHLPVFGVAHRLSSKGKLEFLSICTNDRAAIIHFDNIPRPTVHTKQELPIAKLLKADEFTLVGFNLSKTALHLNASTLLHVRGIDFAAVYKDPKKGSAFSAAEIVQKRVSDRADTWEILRLWNNENGQMERDLCLQAWLAYLVGKKMTESELENAQRVDTSYLNCAELDLITRMVREADLLSGAQTSETVGDFSSAVVDKSGHVKLLNSRYKTRIRKSEHAKIILTDSSGKEHWGKAAAAKGKTTTIQLQASPAGGLKFEKVRVYGRQEALNHEKARDALVIRLLTRDKTLRDAPFIRALWFPKWKPTFFVRGDGGVDEDQATVILRDVRLNQSQRSATLSMVSADPVVIVHGPPGTGKTTTIAASAKVWHLHRRPVWIVAHSNVAVKNIAVSLYKHDVDFRLIVSKDFHFEWHEHLYEKINERLIRSDDFQEDPRHTAKFFSGVHVVLCTLSMLSNPVLRSSGLLDYIRMERLIIDEASQINAFEYLQIFDKYYQTLEKVCFFGDPHQLPPFGKTDAPTIQTIFDLDKKIACKTFFLDTQYRMPRPIGEFISRAVYQGRLKSQHPITTPDCLRFIDVQSCEEKAGYSWKNRREVDTLVHLVKNYYSATNFCIITPYDAQRALIQATLEGSNLQSDTVFNLDSFQGNEADYILISVVRTSKPGFLNSLQRLNVLLTRAKKGLIIVTNRPFLREGGSHTLLGKLAHHWQAMYRSNTTWVDWRLVSQNQASLPGAWRAEPRSSGSQIPSVTQSHAVCYPPSRPKVYSEHGRSLGSNLHIYDAAQWPALPVILAPRPPNWPTVRSLIPVPYIGPQLRTQVKPSKAQIKGKPSGNLTHNWRQGYNPPLHITFIECLSPEDNLSISKNSLESVTQTVTAYKFVSPVWEEQANMHVPIIVVDTPGLLDSKMSEAHVLKDLQKWQKENVDLKTSQITFSHLVMYFERITDKRMSGSKRRAIRIFKSLLGPGAVNGRVNIITTMWNQIPGAKGMAAAMERYQELQNEFWKDEIEDGLGVRRFEGTPQSALWIFTQLVSIASDPRYLPGELSKGFAFQQVGIKLGEFNNHPEDNAAIRVIIHNDLLERIAAVRMRIGMAEEELNGPTLDRALKRELKRERRQAYGLLGAFLTDLALLSAQDSETCPMPKELENLHKTCSKEISRSRVREIMQLVRARFGGLLYYIHVFR
ncbi:hypothetical protein CVT24_001684 [Panaeolus cyanescens]|uniref:DNA2/NAM7 helicase-like C-terminal domain-containing protein n=1 Tax=Panaeolus cyanescens TaxID=181874 RepID=A0A409YFN5_9AGAR|nr:hypothetical protein CVT24_001684 [Panaeolus cyanescens]